jgi:RNA polymerase sigma-70 factor (ECF subfamily)
VLREFENITEQELARGVQAGSDAAFEELVYRYERRIYSFALTFCRNPADAQELTQDTFVKAFRARHRLKSDREVAPWLFVIARRTCIDHYRSAPPKADQQMPELADEREPAEQIAQGEESASVWELARRLLPAAQFEALWLRYAEDLSVAQVAVALGRTNISVRVLLFRARERLARQIKRENSQILNHHQEHKQIVKRAADMPQAYEKLVS